MPTFLRLHVEGQWQSWGTVAPTTDRPTEPFPTKSGVLGLISAALGLQRGDERITTLHQATRVSARALRTGRVQRDFHVVMGIQNTDKVAVRWNNTTKRRDPSGKKGSLFHPTLFHQYDKKDTNSNKISDRYYLEDWAFEVVIEWDHSIAPFPLSEVVSALRRPRFPLYLGRKSCLPSMPLIPNPETAVIEADSPQEVFREPTLDEVGFRCPWHWMFTRAPDERREEESLKWLRERYAAVFEQSGSTYLDVPERPPHAVPHHVRDHMVRGSYYIRMLYEIPPLAEATREQEATHG